MLKISGYTLLEVMISMLLLTLALLSMDITAVQSLHENHKTYSLSVAVNEIETMSERLQALGNTPGLNDLIQLWNQELQSLLPQGHGQVTGMFPTYEITLFWGEKKQDLCEKITDGCLKASIQVV